MISKRRLGKHGAVVAGILLTGGLVAGGATAYAAGSDSSSASAQPASAEAAHQHPGRHWHRRPFALGVHGQATVRNARTGRFVVREWQRGQITALSGDQVTVKSADGTSWTWTVDNNARITRDGKRIAESALKDGDKVLVLGKQAGSTNDAVRIFAPSPAQIAKMKAKAAQYRANS